MVWFKVTSLGVFFWRPLEQLCNKCRNSGASLHSLWYSCWVISCWQTGDTDVNVYYIRPLFCTPAMTSLFLDLFTFQCRKWLHDINFRFILSLVLFRRDSLVMFMTFHMLTPCFCTARCSVTHQKRVFADHLVQGPTWLVSWHVTSCALWGVLYSYRRCLLTTEIHTKREND